MRPDDLLRLRSINEVAMSADGRRAAFAYSSIDSDRDRELTAICAIDIETGALTQLTDGLHRDQTIAWSPVGSTIAFLSSDRHANAAGAGLFTIDVSGGAIKPIGEPGPIAAPVWSPDAKTICVVRVVPPTPDPSIPAGVRVYDRLHYKDPTRGWLDGSRAHLFLIDVEAGTSRQITFGDWDDHSAVFSPDGRKLAFISSRGAHRDLGRTTDVWILDLETSELECVTDEDDVVMAPSFSPDGTRIAYYAVGPLVGTSRFAHNLGIWIRNVAGGTPRNILSGWDRTASNVLLSETRPHAGQAPPCWTPDGESILFVGSDRGRAHLFRVDTAGTAAPGCLLDGDHEVVAFSANAARTSAVAILSTFDSPPDVHLLDLRGGSRRLTDANASLRDKVYLAKPEHLQVETDGTVIEGWLAKPADFDPTKRYPLVLRIAGGPGLAYGHSFTEETHLLAGAGFVVLQTNPRGSQSYGQEHALTISGDWNNKDYADLMAAVDCVVARGFVDPERMGVMGASYGGHMTNWIITQTDRFAAAVAQRGMSNFVSLFAASAPYTINALRGAFGDINPYETPAPFIEKSPISHVQHAKTPLLLIQAGRDVVTPVEQAEQMFVGMKYYGRDARLIVFENEGHYVRRHGRPSSRVFYLSAIAEWLLRYIDPTAASAEQPAGALV